jgi:hypothetical protein
MFRQGEQGVLKDEKQFIFYKNRTEELLGRFGQLQGLTKG